jgi:chromosome segregation ATPase
MNYITAARKLSGKIKSTEATTLWQASETMRTELRSEIDDLRGRLKECFDRVEALEGQNHKLNSENDDLRRKVDELETEVDRLRGENTVLRAREGKLEARIAELEGGHG